MKSCYNLTGTPRIVKKFICYCATLLLNLLLRPNAYRCIKLLCFSFFTLHSQTRFMNYITERAVTGHITTYNMLVPFLLPRAHATYLSRDLAAMKLAILVCVKARGGRVPRLALSLCFITVSLIVAQLHAMIKTY